MGTQEIVVCDVCKNPLPPEARALAFYITERKTPEATTPTLRVRRRFMVEKECEIDLCTDPACLVELPQVLAKVLKKPVRRRSRRKRKS